MSVSTPAKSEIPPKFKVGLYIQNRGCANVRDALIAKLGCGPTSGQVHKWAVRDQVSAAWANAFSETFGMPVKDLLPRQLVPAKPVAQLGDMLAEQPHEW
jgi:hypothetical protein